MLISNGTRRRLVEIPTHPQFGLQTTLAAQTDGKKDRASSTDTAAAANKWYVVGLIVSQCTDGVVR